MSDQQKQVYLGIDWNPKNIQISYCRQGMGEPEIVKKQFKEEEYQIFQEGITPGFLQEMLKTVPNLQDISQISALTFHLQEMSLEKIKQIQEMVREIQIPQSRVWIQDTRECFCHFAMNQKEELTKHDMMLFLCEENQVICYYLRKNQQPLKKEVEIQVLKTGILPEEEKERDLAFAEITKKILTGRMISSIYIMGQGFEGGWMQESLAILCRGRRVFQGKHFFAKGACYTSVMEIHQEECDYVFQGEYKLKKNVLLQVKNGDRRFYKELALAGHKYYELGGSCHVLLQGDPSVDLWIQSPGSSKAKIENLKLADLPKRPGKATRLKIELLPGEPGKIAIKITDLGFGQWYPSSQKVWEYCINE